MAGQEIARFSHSYQSPSLRKIHSRVINRGAAWDVGEEICDEFCFHTAKKLHLPSESSSFCFYPTALVKAGACLPLIT